MLSTHTIRLYVELNHLLRKQFPVSDLIQHIFNIQLDE